MALAPVLSLVLNSFKKFFVQSFLILFFFRVTDQIGIIIACLFVLVVIAVIIAIVITKVAGGNSSSNGRYQNM
jgi:hypothetical protein